MSGARRAESEPHPGATGEHGGGAKTAGDFVAFRLFYFILFYLKSLTGLNKGGCLGMNWHMLSPIDNLLIRLLL